MREEKIGEQYFMRRATARMRHVSLTTCLAGLTLLTAGCATGRIDDNCVQRAFNDYRSFDADTLRLVVALPETLSAAPFFSLEANDKTGQPMSLALRLERSADWENRGRCAADLRMNTYRITSTDAAWRVFWMQADGPEFSFDLALPADAGVAPGGDRSGLMLVDTARYWGVVVCGCLGPGD